MESNGIQGKEDEFPAISIIDQLAYPKSTVIVEQYVIPELNVTKPPALKKLEEIEKSLLGNLKKLEMSKGITLVDDCEKYPRKTRLVDGYKRVHIILREKSSFKAIKGAMHYMKGKISLTTKLSLNIKKQVLPTYEGVGEVWLEPFTQQTYFMLFPVPPKAKIIVEHSHFYACSGDLKTSLKIVKQNIALALLGGEGLLITEYHVENTNKKDSGWLILMSKTPQNEIQKIELKKETLKVDGDFAFLRTGGVGIKIEAVAKGAVAKMLDLTGEGVVRVYSGTGTVHLHPTSTLVHRQADNK